MKGARRTDGPHPRQAAGLGRKAVLLAVAIAMAVLLASCGGSSNSNNNQVADTAAQTTAKDAAPQTRGGTLKFARSLDASVGLNPINAPDNGSIFTIQQIFDQLVEVRRLRARARAWPKSWETSADGLTWTFHLRDAKFSNGDPVTADDVEFSLERFADPKINVELRDPRRVDRHGRRQSTTTPVQITLNRVDGAFLDNIAMFAAAIVPQKVVEDDRRQGVRRRTRSAPARSWSRSSSAASRRCSCATRTTGARASRIWTRSTFEFVPDANTRTLELRSGEVDVADGDPLQPGRRRSTPPTGSRSRSRTRSSGTRSSSTRKEPPLDEVEVRQALAYATPNEQILDAVLFGNAQVANSQIPRVKYWDDSIQPYPYDIDKAKELLGQSSVPDGFDLELQIPSGDAVEKQTAEIIKSEWAKIGVNVTIVPARLRDHVRRLARGQGRRGRDVPRRRALQRHALRRRDRGADVRPEGRAELARDVLRQPEGHPASSQTPRARSTRTSASRTSPRSSRSAWTTFPSVPLFFTKSVTGYQDNVQNFQTYPIGWWPLREVWISQ